MRWIVVTCLTVVIALGLGQGARADEPPPTQPPSGLRPGGPAARDEALASGLAALRLRMEAKLKEVELLQQAGKLDAALAAAREVDRLFRDGLADLERLLGRSGTPAATPARLPSHPTPGVAASEDWDGFDDRAFLRSRAEERIVNGPPQPKKVAVLHGLKWLAAHQSADGGWESAGFGRWCDGKLEAAAPSDGAGDARHDVGATGLALSAFLTVGYSHRGDHDFAEVVKKGLAYLKRSQDAEGCFGARTSHWFIYDHARAAHAMVEAYGLTRAPALRAPAQKALDFIAQCRNPYLAWRYGVRPGENDTSVTAWVGLPLLRARALNAEARKLGLPEALVLDEGAFRGITAWLDKMTDPELGRVGYQQRGGPPARTSAAVNRFPAEKSESLTAMAVLLRGWMDPSALRLDSVKKGVDLVARLVPTWNTGDGSIDFEHWYFGTLALWQVGGEAWTLWDKALHQVARAGAQRLDGTYCGLKGSWDPVDPWSPELGRVYSTALVTMCLADLGRYERGPAPR